MTIIYRETDPVSGRWTGNSGGIDLTAFQIDQNFYEAISRIATLESNESFTVSIDFITISGNSLTFHMTNHTLQGPFAIPVSVFVDRGTWQPLTVYSVNDTFHINGTLYLVIFDHTSAATFSAGANDGLGHNFYSAMLSLPGAALPTGGATGQVLQKSSGADFAVTWGYKLPTGGITGQVLSKASNTNQDAHWENFPGLLPPPSPGGLAGQVIATVDGTNENVEWVSVVRAPPPSPAGTAGQVLSTVDGTDTNTKWINAGGGGGFSPVISSVVDGDQLRYDSASVEWINRSIFESDIGAASGPISVDPDATPVITVTPAGDIAFGNAARSGKLGQVMVISILTSGVTSHNITFSSTDWVGQGTLATGTVTAKTFNLSFMCGGDGKLYEMSRIGPF